MKWEAFWGAFTLKLQFLSYFSIQKWFIEILSYGFKTAEQTNIVNWWETFHIVSKCKTSVYFSWSLVQAIDKQIQMFWGLVLKLASHLVTADRLMLTTINRDRTRLDETVIYKIQTIKCIFTLFKVVLQQKQQLESLNMAQNLVIKNSVFNNSTLFYNVYLIFPNVQNANRVQTFLLNKKNLNKSNI